MQTGNIHSRVAPGDYVLGLDVGPIPDKDSPYADTFYPSEPLREAPESIHLELGQEIKLPDIITSTDRCAIVLRVLDAAGKPASGATSAAQVLDHDHFYVLFDPEVETNGRAIVPAWGHGRIQIYANLEIGSGRLQSEPQWVQLCPQNPVVLRLNYRYEDEEKEPHAPDRP